MRVFFTEQQYYSDSWQFLCCRFDVHPSLFEKGGANVVSLVLRKEWNAIYTTKPSLQHCTDHNR